MATKSTARKKSTTSTGTKKSTKSGTRRKKSPSKQQVFHDEVTLIVTIVVSILLILGLFNLGGVVGKFFDNLSFGLMGYLAYVFPFLLFCQVAFSIANRGNVYVRNKVIGFGLLCTCFCAGFHLVCYSYLHSSFLSFYSLCSKNHNGGGIIGAAVGNLLKSMFGVIGAAVILIAMMLILFMFISDKLLFAELKKYHKKRQKIRAEQRKYYEEMHGDEFEEEVDIEPYNVSYAREGGEPNKRKAKTVNFLQGLKQDQKPKKKVELSQVQELSDPKAEVPLKKEPVVGYPDPAMASDDIGEPVYESEMKQKFEKEPEQDKPQEVEPVLDFEITRMEEPEEMPFDEQEDLQVEPMGFEEANEIYQEESAPVIEEEKPTHTKKETKQENTSAETLEIHPDLEEKKEYVFPPINLLAKPKGSAKGMSDRELKETAVKLQKTLESFGVRVTITNVSCGPTVTRYELQPEQGVKVSKITGLADDIKLNLAAADVRIEAPIPGKAAVGIEVPNKVNTMVSFRDLIEGKEFKEFNSDIAFAVGKDIGGQTVVTDIAKMPHLLIAGATGSGKSVCINTLIMSILYKANPNDVKLIMVDPKVVELSVYNGIPHLLIPVVTDPKKASAALNWAVMEMTERYKKFAALGVRDIKGYNSKIKEMGYSNDPNIQKMPQIVIIVDELADLMMVAPGEVEDAICRLAQMARAAGLHLIIATQRPSVNVITGLIKANVPSRIAFSVSSAIDSRTILDGSGAEKLLGKGDMLFFPSGYPKPVRIQGAFISDREVSEVVEFLSKENEGHVTVNQELEGKITSAVSSEGGGHGGSDRDEYFIDAGKFIIEKDKASIGMLQRVFKVGFNRAARIMDQLNDAGVVGPEEGTKPRKVLMSMEEFEQYVDEYV
ncbi:cell division protein FtsK [Lachnospiraceae bacterium KM106-2]|nr:cell division protein FtsK [Lachnospiraceae bacterium KM106-2]